MSTYYPYEGREGDYFDGYEDMDAARSDAEIGIVQWAEYLIETGRAYQ